MAALEGIGNLQCIMENDFWDRIKEELFCIESLGRRGEEGCLDLSLLLHFALKMKLGHPMPTHPNQKHPPQERLCSLKPAFADNLHI